MMRSGSAADCLQQVLHVISSSSSSTVRNIYQGDMGQHVAINIVVVNPPNTHSHSPLFAEHVFFGNSMWVKIAEKQLSVPLHIYLHRRSQFFFYCLNRLTVNNIYDVLGLTSIILQGSFYKILYKFYIKHSLSLYIRYNHFRWYRSEVFCIKRLHGVFWQKEYFFCHVR